MADGGRNSLRNCDRNLGDSSQDKDVTTPLTPPGGASDGFGGRGKLGTWAKTWCDGAGRVAVSAPRRSRNFDRNSHAFHGDTGIPVNIETVNNNRCKMQCI